MANFAGQQFSDFSIPLVFEERYFVLEAGNPPLITVVMEVGGEPVFEILKNQPVENDVTVTSIDSAGIVTVSDKISGSYLYKVEPALETCVVFAGPDDTECPAVVTAREIRIGGLVIDNSPYHDSMAGVIVDPEIGAGLLGAPLPEQVAHWFA